MIRDEKSQIAFVGCGLDDAPQLGKHRYFDFDVPPQTVFEDTGLHCARPAVLPAEVHRVGASSARVEQYSKG